MENISKKYSFVTTKNIKLAKALLISSVLWGTTTSCNLNKNNADTEEALNQLKDEHTAVLTKKDDDHVKEINNLKDDIKKLTKERDDLQKEIKNLIDNNSEDSYSDNELTDNASNIEKLAEINQKILDKLSKLHDLQTDHNDETMLEEDLGNHEKNQEKKTQKAEAKAKKAEAQAKKAKEKAEAKTKKEEEKAKKAEEKAKEKEKEKEKEKAEKEKQKKTTELQANLEKLQGKLQTIAEKIALTSALKKEAEQKMEDHQTTQTDLSNQKKEKEGECAKIEEGIKKLVKGDTDEARKQYKEAKKQFTTEKEALKEEIVKLKVEITDCNNKRVYFKEKVGKLTKRLEHEMKEGKDMKEQVEQAELAIANLQK